MKTRYSFPSDTGHLKEVRKFIDLKLVEFGVGGLLKSHLILAVDEACSNAVLHGSKNNLNEIVLELSKSGNKLNISIHDVGSFNIDNTFIEEDLSERIARRQKGGLGLLLIRTIMDEVKYYNDNGINYCSLTKYLP